MGYTSPIDSIQLFQEGTDLIVSSDSTAENGYFDTPKTAKELTLQIKIYRTSVFNAKVELRSHIAGGTGYGQFYHNNTAVGASFNTGGAGWVQHSVDITGQEWFINDTLSLVIWSNGSPAKAQVKNLRIYALRTPLEVTQENVI